jgi:hypothetical protein
VGAANGFIVDAVGSFSPPTTKQRLAAALVQTTSLLRNSQSARTRPIVNRDDSRAFRRKVHRWLIALTSHWFTPIGTIREAMPARQTHTGALGMSIPMERTFDTYAEALLLPWSRV